MNYIIFGGSGFIGTHLIHMLKELKDERVKDGDDIAYINHIYDLDIVMPGEEGVVPGIVEKNEGVEYIRYDVRKPIDLTFTPTSTPTLIPTPDDVIFNLAAVHRTPGHEDHEYFETNIRGAENVVAFAEKYGIKKILFTSSIAPYGASEELKNEDTLPTPNTPYGISKLVAEKIHMIWQAKDPSRELTILRPGIVYGKGEHGNMTRLYKGIKGHYYFYAGRKDTVKACIYVKDLVQFMKYRMIDHSYPGVDIINCTFEPAYTIEQICEAMKASTGLTNKIPMVNGKLLMITARILEPIGGKKVGIHPDRVKKLMISTNIRGKKLVETDYKFHYTLEGSFADWLADCRGEKLKILQIPNYFYPNIGGIEQVARDITNALSSTRKYEQKIICFNETAANGDYVCRRGETVHDIVDGVEVIRCGCVTKKASQSISITFGKELNKVMNEFNPDVIIFHYPNPFEAQFLMKYLKRNVHFILYWHLDIVKQKVLGKLFHGQTIKLLERAEQVIATSPLYIDGSYYLSKFKDKCIVIPNTISSNRMVITPEIEKKAAQIRDENKNKIICFGVGRHIPYKGFKYLVEASKYLDDRFRIFIGGKGELTEELKRQAGDDKKITFLGRVSDEDLIAYYLAMDIFCFPSITKNEAFGIALAEGMYFGKPAITFNVPGSGINYVNIKNVTGLDVTNGDSRAYAEAIKKLADDTELREKMGMAAKHRVEENFTEKQFNEAIINVISKYPRISGGVYCSKLNLLYIPVLCYKENADRVVAADCEAVAA